jgi:glycosyl transferase family 25
MQNIDKIFYINLDSRKDRKEEILYQFKRMNIPEEKIHRFPAISARPGAIGCALSHLNLLMFIKQKGYTNTIIFEDDFDFIVTPDELNQNLNDFFTTIPKYDVAMLSYNLHGKGEFNKVCGRALDVQTTSGYMIHKDFLDKLINLYKKTTPLLIKTNATVERYVCDQSWKSLQPQSRWFYFNQRLGIQRPSHSDIENNYTDYGI